MKEIVLDTETTGLSVRDGHRIVEIGCIELDNLVPTKNIFHFYLNPERKVSEKAFEVHGYSDEFLATKQKFAEIADDFIDFIKDKKIIIHNAEFDIGHLNNELSLIGKSKINKSVSLVVSKVGSGNAVMFADNPNFRGAWYGTNRLFLNAIFLGDKIDIP